MFFSSFSGWTQMSKTQLGKESSKCYSVLFVVTITKMVMMHLYRSTDFEVHRNWLSITYSHPLSEWYFEDSSEWTLDYPPFFAYFEWLLSQIAVHFDIQMLNNDPYYASVATIIFQRLSVILSDVVLFYAVLRFFETWPRDYYGESKITGSKKFAILVVIMANPGLLFVDHIHFQYNGFLLGILIMAVTLIRQSKDLEAAFVFSILLNFKHIFLYVSPVFFCYLLGHYCYEDDDDCEDFSSSSSSFEGWEEMELKERTAKQRFSVKNFFKIATIVLLVFSISFGPFALVGSLTQILRRLFPFGQRGLCHSYWAANIWSLYNTMDRTLFAVKRFLLKDAAPPIVASATRGLVENFSHLVLPTISSTFTVILTISFMMPVLVSMFRRPHPRAFLAGLMYCSLCSFMFGWHVHEKAILMVIIPLGLSAADSEWDSKAYFLLSTVGHFSLLPLLFQTQELPIKAILLVMYSLLSYSLLNNETQYRLRHRRIKSLGLSYVAVVYYSGFIVLFLATQIFLPLMVPQWEFLPLLLISVYCAIGNIYGLMMLHSQYYRRLQCLDSYD